MTVSGAEFATLLERRGFDFFAGVPCSLIEDLIATLEAHPRLPYVPAPREDVYSTLSYDGRKHVYKHHRTGYVFTGVRVAETFQLPSCNLSS